MGRLIAIIAWLLVSCLAAQAQVSCPGSLITNCPTPTYYGLSVGDNGSPPLPPYSLTDIAPGVFTNLGQNNTMTSIVNGLTPAIARQIGQLPGIYNTEAIFGGVAAPANAAVPEVDGAFFSATTLSPATYAVGAAVYATSLVANTITFGLNVLVGDGGCAACEGSGGTYFPNGVVGVEWDVGAGSIDSTVLGSNMIGVFPNGTPGSVYNPSYPLAQATAYQVSIDPAFPDFGPWGVGFKSLPGAAIVAASIGPQTASADSDGQAVQLFSSDDSNTQWPCGIQAVHKSSSGNLNLVCQNGDVTVSSPFTVYNDASIGGTLGIEGMAIVATTATSGTQAMGATTVVLASTTGISTGDFLTGSASISGNTQVSSVVDGTHITISTPLLSAISNGVTVTFFTFVQTGNITTTPSTTDLVISSPAGSMTLSAESGHQVILGSLLQFTPILISALPTCNSGEAGTWAYISNGVASPTYQQSVSSTGSTGQFVGCNGAAWTYH